jgi:hypothetical protein
MFLDVGFDREKILVDEIRRFLVFERLGFQPSAGASGRRRAEVEQDGPVLLARHDQRLINVLAPIYGHTDLLCAALIGCREQDSGSPYNGRAAGCAPPMNDSPWKSSVDAAVNNQDWAALVSLAGEKPARVLRYLTGRLCSADETVKWNSIRALAALAGDRQRMSEERVRELLRRFLWMLSDESGNVPFGVPEACGEVLAARPELQPEFLPLLCAFAYDPERMQTGRIEQGVFWALGRVGQAAAACSPRAAEAVARAAADHPEPQTRSIARWAQSRF